MQNWNEVKYNMMVINVNGIKGRLWAGLRLIFTGKIPTGTTWGQIDENIQSYKSVISKLPTVSTKDI